MELKGRKRVIYDILCEKGRVSVKELSKMIYVSEMTVRRCLGEMEEEGLLERYRGGAVLNGAGVLLPISQRMLHGEREKKLLAAKAAELLKDNMTVFIDSSSTCQYIVPHLPKFENIKVVTNSLDTLLKVSKLKVPCILIGGEYYSFDRCFVGSIAEEYAGRFNVDIAFFSVMGLSDDGVLSDDIFEQSAVRKEIMRNSERNVYIFEQSKLHKKYFYTVCRTEDVDDVIVISEEF